MYSQSNAYSKGNQFIYGLGLGPFDLSDGNPQTQFTLKGKIIDGATNKPLADVHVYYTRNKQKTGVISNQNGYYELEATPNDIITMSFVGYDTVEAPADQIMSTEYMYPKAEELDTIYLTNKKKKNILMAAAGAFAIIIGVSLAKNGNKTKSNENSNAN